MLNKFVQEGKAQKDQGMSSRFFKVKLTLKYQILSVGFHEFSHICIWNHNPDQDMEHPGRISHTHFSSPSLGPYYPRVISITID